MPKPTLEEVNTLQPSGMSKSKREMPQSQLVKFSHSTMISTFNRKSIKYILMKRNAKKKSGINKPKMISVQVRPKQNGKKNLEKSIQKFHFQSKKQMRPGQKLSQEKLRNGKRRKKLKMKP